MRSLCVPLVVVVFAAVKNLISVAALQRPVAPPILIRLADDELNKGKIVKDPVGVCNSTHDEV